MNQERGLWPHHRSLIWLQLLLTRHGEHLHNRIRCDGLQRGSIINIHIPSRALALPPLKIPRDAISLLLTGQLSMGSARQLTWMPNYRWCQKVLPLPHSFFSSTAVAKQQFGTSSVLPQTSSLSSALPGTCTQAQPCFSPGCSPQGAQDHQALFMDTSAQKQTQCWGQNRFCSHGSCPYTSGWHILVSCKSDPVQEAAEIFLSPLLASHAPDISDSCQ